MWKKREAAIRKKDIEMAEHARQITFRVLVEGGISVKSIARSTNMSVQEVEEIIGAGKVE